MITARTCPIPPLVKVSLFHPVRRLLRADAPKPVRSSYNECLRSKCEVLPWGKVCDNATDIRGAQHGYAGAAALLKVSRLIKVKSK